MKKITFSLLILLSLSLLCSCSGADPITDVNVLKDSLLSLSYQDELELISQNTADSLLDISGLYESAEYYCSSGATAEQIVIVKASSGKANDVFSKLSAFLDDQKTQFAGYNPAETSKLNNAILEMKGDYVILCVTNEDSKAKDIVSRFTI